MVMSLMVWFDLQIIAEVKDDGEVTMETNADKWAMVSCCLETVSTMSKTYSS